jgi:hypothetical protein
VVPVIPNTLTVAAISLKIQATARASKACITLGVDFQDILAISRIGIVQNWQVGALHQ